MKFEANLKIIGKKVRKYYIHVGPNERMIKKSHNRFCNLHLKGKFQDWISIFSNEQTLIGAYNLGKIKMTHIREQYILKLVFFSEAIHGFNQRRLNLMRTRNYLKIFPTNILRAFVGIIFTLIRNTPSKIMELLMKMLEKIMSRID
ncbi:MAG: hypothetical protein ACTSVY_05990 [Candidatus Helarchaeota archaeon]